jgi:hypothetical protein
VNNAVPVTRAEPASLGQRLLWLMNRYRGGNGMMGVPLLYRMRGPLDQRALSEAVAGLVDRHEALRTTFGMHRRALHQFIHEPGEISVPHHVTDLSSRAAGTSAVGTAAAQQRMADQVRAFLRADLDHTSCPLATGLWRLAPNDHVLVLNVHHFVTDAWSNMVLSRDLAALYSAALRGIPAALPPVAWQQADYVAWQRERLRGAILQQHQAYWTEHLRDATFARLPDNRSPGGPRAEAKPGVFMANEWFVLPPELLAGLRSAARATRGTLFSMLLAAMMAALRELTGQEDLAIGSIFANRARPQVRQTVGFLANMVVVRASALASAGRDAFLDGVRRSMLGALAHEELPFLAVPFSSVQDAASPARGRPEDVVFHMLAVPPDAGFDKIRFAGLDTEPLRIPDGLGSRFDLEVLIVPSPDGLDGVIRYTPDRFDAEYIQRFARLYLAAAQSLAAHPVGEARTLPKPAPLPT